MATSGTLTAPGSSDPAQLRTGELIGVRGSWSGSVAVEVQINGAWFPADSFSTNFAHVVRASGVYRINASSLSGSMDYALGG